MNKKIFALIIATLSVCTVSLSAQTQNATLEPQQKQGVCGKERQNQPECCVKQEATQPKANACNKRESLFTGIELNAEQKAKLEELRLKRAKEREETKLKALETRLEQNALRNEEVKKILTAEQYAQYEANVKAAQEREKATRGDKIKKEGKRHGKGGKKSLKGIEQTKCCNHKCDSVAKCVKP